MKVLSKKAVCAVMSLTLAVGLCPTAAFGNTLGSASPSDKAGLTAQWATIPLSGATVALEYTSCIYSGMQRCPVVTVTLNGQTLNEGTDFFTSYRNNTDVGKAQVFITGWGEYSGTAEASFEIKPASIADRNMTLNVQTFKYDGNEHEPLCIVSGVVQGTGYSVEYRNNVNAGTADAIVTGKGNYTGSKTLHFTIKKATNPISGLRTSFVSLKSTKLAKKKRKVSRSKAFDIRDAEGKVTFKKKSGTKKIKVSKKGKVTVAKGTKRGYYRIEVKAKAAGNKNYKKKTVKRTLYVTVI